MMAIVDHGSWTRYTRETTPDNFPASTIFLKRQSDDMDWYDYVHPHNQFQATSVKFTVNKSFDGTLDIIRAPNINEDALFPDSMLVVELLGDYSGYTTEELITMFSSKVIDLTTGDITDPPPVTPQMTPVEKTLNEILKRLDKLEQSK